MLKITSTANKLTLSIIILLIFFGFSLLNPSYSLASDSSDSGSDLNLSDSNESALNKPGDPGPNTAASRQRKSEELTSVQAEENSEKNLPLTRFSQLKLSDSNSNESALDKPGDPGPSTAASRQRKAKELTSVQSEENSKKIQPPRNFPDQEIQEANRTGILVRIEKDSTPDTILDGLINQYLEKKIFIRPSEFRESAEIFLEINKITSGAEISVPLDSPSLLSEDDENKIRLAYEKYFSLLGKSLFPKPKSK